MSKFTQQLGYLKPKGTIWVTLDRVHIPEGNPKPVRLELLPAGRTNGAFTSALLKLKRESKDEGARTVTLEALDASDERQAKLFAKHVVVGWEEVCDGDMQPMPFSSADVEDLLVTIAVEQKSPDIVNLAYVKAYDLDNFRDEPLGTAEALGKR